MDESLILSMAITGSGRVVMCHIIKLMCLWGLGSLFSVGYAQSDEQRFASLLNLSLSELMLVQVSDAGSLTGTSQAKVPAAVTHITQEDIQLLGARSLLELLEMTVPGLQMTRHHYELPHLGIRGIISDREDKVMIRVNGRVMNERTGRGAITERDFPLMGDIKQINVIRGAGSSMYGLGAVAMVIDIQTFDSQSLEQDSLSVRGGAGMLYKAIDLNISQRLDNGLGVYFHTELADVNGANGEDAPLIFAAEGVSINSGETIPRGEPMPTHSRDWQGFRGQPFKKLHLGLDYEDSHLWLRYTEAGRNIATMFRGLVEPPEGLDMPRELMSQIGYNQFTATFEQQRPVFSDTELSWMFSYDRTNITKVSPFPSSKVNYYGESELFGRVVARWSATPDSDLALGAEYAYEEYGLDNEQSSRGLWDTYTVSVLGEWQWRPNADWTLFFGGRLDRHTYTDTLFSPRASMVYSSDDVNTYKLLLTQSRRMNIAQANRNAELSGNSQGDTEVLNSIEARYERVSENSFLGLSLFYINLDALGWDKTARNSSTIGNQTQWGFEAEQVLTYDRHALNLSFAYTKLIDFKLYGQNTTITAQPLGYGNDLADWATYSAKLRYRYDISEQTQLTSTLRAFWGYQGSKDYGEYLLDNGSPFITEEGYTKAYREQVYLNLGLRHQPTQDVTLSVDFHNVLGILDKDLNKRIYRGSLGGYRAEAVAVSAGISVSF